METTERTLTGRQLRTRLMERGMSVADLAREAGMPRPNMSAVLAGRTYVGPARRARIEEAIVRLGLHRDEPPESQAVEEPVFTIRSSE